MTPGSLIGFLGLALVLGAAVARAAPSSNAGTTVREGRPPAPARDRPLILGVAATPPCTDFVTNEAETAHCPRG